MNAAKDREIVKKKPAAVCQSTATWEEHLFSSETATPKIQPKLLGKCLQTIMFMS